MAEKEQGTRRLEIQHFSHKEHPLRSVYRSGYTCDGCGEAGYGFRYQCSLCNFDLHESCARAPKSKRHSCHPQHLLKFREKLFSPNIVCDVCREKISGFSYERRGCNIDLHPSCAKLPFSLQHPLHPHHKLQLVPCNSTRYSCNIHVMYVDEVFLLRGCAIAAATATILHRVTSSYTFHALNDLSIRWKR